MTPSRTPGQLLVDARIVASSDHAVPTATWGRAVAVLSRQAMEGTLRAYWGEIEPAMLQVRNQRASFLCLRHYLAPDTAADAYYAWAVLSRACHFGAYDVEASIDEVNGWIDGAARFLDAAEQGVRTGA